MNAQLIAVAGPFDDLRSRHFRFLEEAARLGEVNLFLWSDELIKQRLGRPPKFPEAERQYLLEALRFVRRVHVVNQLDPPGQLPVLPRIALSTWVLTEEQDTAGMADACRRQGIACRVIPDAQLGGFPAQSFTSAEEAPGVKRVLATGCYDWFHSGHVRFFEEVSTYGRLYVVVGHDANIRLLKGEGHPLLPQEERRYLVGSVRYVAQAVVSSGQGWLDAEPEIAQIKPHIYAVNDDGDKGGKREFCARHGIQYLVLKRHPAPGLPQRTSTNLRGF